MKYIDNIDFNKIKTHSDIDQSEVDGLDVVKETIDLKSLVDDPKKLQTYDTHISPNEALERLLQGETDEYLLKVVTKDPITAFAYVERVLKKPFPLGEPIIASRPYTAYHYAEEVLEGPFLLGEPVMAKNAHTSLAYALNVLKGPFTLGEPAMAKDRNVSVVYARDVLKGPFPLAEPNIYNDVYWRKYYEKEVLKGRPWTGLDQQVTEALDLKNLVDDPKKLQTYDTHISPDEAYYKLATGATDEYLIKIVAQDPQTAYKYAKYEINDRFPLGEPVIAKDEKYSYWYAKYVLKGPFPLGEPAIAKSASYSYLYAEYVLKGPFPLGEPTIAKSALHSLAYAKDVLKGPFPLGEPAIYKTTWRTNYETGVLKGRPWTGLDKKIDEAMDLKSLVDDPNKLQTKDTHLGPKDALKKLKFGATDSYLYDILAQDPHIVVDYVDWYYTRRQFEGEPFANSRISKSIATSPGASLRYAEITNKPFAEGEPAIARDYLTSYYYARDLLKGPFPLGEPAIYNSRYKDKYEMKVLRGKPWTGLDQKVDEAIDLKTLVSDPKKLKTHDTHISPQEAYARLEKGETDEYLIRAIAKNAGYSYLYARDILKKRFPLGEPAISNSAKYSCLYAIYVLKKRFPLGEPAIAKSAVDSFFYAKDVLEFKPFSLGEPAIAKDGWYSYIYARDVLKKPWPLGEPAIAKDAMYSYRYEKYVLKGKPWTGLDQKIDEAMDLKNLVDDPKKLKTHDTHISPKEAYTRILNGEKEPYLEQVISKNPYWSINYAINVSKKPFPLGEPIIATSAVDSYYYARYVLQKPFPLGEPAIAKDPETSYNYAKIVLEKPFPLGEPAISKNATWSFYYAKDVLKGPFPMGEPAIAKHIAFTNWYAENILKGRPWTSLDQKVDESINLKKLVSDPKKLKTVDTHISPEEAYNRWLKKGETDEYLVHVIAKSAMYSYGYAYMTKKPFPLGEPAIAKDAMYSYYYAKKILKKKPFPLGEPAIATSPVYSYAYAVVLLNKPWPPGEPIIAKNAEYSYDYAKRILKGPFPLGEPAIYKNIYTRPLYEKNVLKGRPWTGLDQKVDESMDLKNLVSDPKQLQTYDTHISPHEAYEQLKNGHLHDTYFKVVATDTTYAMFTAVYVLQGPFPLGEPAIAKDGDFSYEYASEVLKGRFPLGEPILATNTWNAYHYAKLIKEPFPLGEPAIAKSGFYSLAYAKLVLKGPFPLGEKAIYNDPKREYYQIYSREVLKGRPWTGLDQKVDEALNLKDLVSDPSKLKTHETHVSPTEALKLLKAGQKDNFLISAVAKSSRTALLYAKWINKRFELGEPMIAKDGVTAYLYARKVLKSPFPEGENAIYNSDMNVMDSHPTVDVFLPVRDAYERFVLKGRPWTGLDQQVDEAIDLKKLVSDPKKLKTYKTHISPQEAYERLENGENDDLLVHTVAKSPEHSYYYALNVLNGPFPLGEPAIAKDSSWSFYYSYNILRKRPWTGLDQKVDESINLKKLVKDPTKLKTVDTHVKPNKANARLFARKIRSDIRNNNGIATLEQIKILYKIMVDYGIYPSFPYMTQHAYFIHLENLLRIIKTKGLEHVAKSSLYSFIYAMFVRSRFPLGEPAISKRYEYAYSYALEILKGRFLLAEPSIIKRPDDRLDYAQYVIKGPWPEAEPYISKSSDDSFFYAREILKGPFPLGEPAIYVSNRKDDYEKYVLKGRPWTGLKKKKNKVKEAIDLKKLVTDPAKLKTADTHISAEEAWKKFKKGDKDPALIYAIASDASTAFKYAKYSKKRFELGEKAIAKYGGTSLKYSKMLKTRFKLGEPAIAETPWLSIAYAKMHNFRFKMGEPAILKSQWAGFDAVKYARDVLKKPWPAAEPYILKFPATAYMYARDVLKRRWLKAEPIILENTPTSFEYARDVVKGPWKKAEKSFAELSNYSYLYAKEVLKRPFPLGEPAIAELASNSYLYAKDVLQGPFPLGEPAIASNPLLSYNYARDVLKGPFPLGEPAIYKNSWARSQYIQDVLRKYNKNWTNTGTTANNTNESIDLKNLVSDPTQLQTYDTHIGPNEAYERLSNGETDDLLIHVVAKDAGYSLRYAYYILKDRFILGEPAIAKSTVDSYLYANNIIKGPWPPGEPAIAKNSKYSYWYAKDVLKGPFPLGEPKIYNSLLRTVYKKQILKGKPWTGLDNNKV